jgi:signal transduction histidine kinase
MLVMVAGLLLAQLATVAILVQDRERFAGHMAGRHVAQRIASLVSLLDDLTPAERRRAARAFSGPRTSVRILESPPAPAVDASVPGSALLGTLLRAQLGGSRSLRVEAVARSGAMGEPRRRPGTGPAGEHRRQRMRHHRGPAFRVSAQLSDGPWLVVEQGVSAEVLEWPSRLLLGLAVLMGSVVVVAIYAVRRVTRPLAALAEAAGALGRDIDTSPLPESGSDEVARASRAFNEMQRRLKRFIDDRSRILTAVSHDLKTPLTRMRLRTEFLPDDEHRRRLQGDVDDMQQMVQSTLDFMRGIDQKESGRPVDMGALVESLVEDAIEQGKDLRADIQPGDPVVAGRPLALKRCLTNLVENALRYAGGAEVVLEGGPDAVVVRVIDRGPGIPAQELERIFEPFYRLDASRGRDSGGAGLGLGIARNLVRGHGGELSLANRRGGGLEAVVTLPR